MFHDAFEGQPTIATLNDMRIVQLEIAPVFYLLNREKRFRPFISTGISTGYNLSKYEYLSRHLHTTADFILGLEMRIGRLRFAPTFRRSQGLQNRFDSEEYQARGQYTYCTLRIY